MLFARRSISSDTLVKMLQKRFVEVGAKWKTGDVRAEIRTFDPGAVGLAGSVLRKLKGDHALSSKLQCELIQGLAVCLRRRGFGVALHITDAASVREQILELARKRFNAVKRKSGLKKARFNANALARQLRKVKEFVSGDGEDSDASGEDDPMEGEKPSTSTAPRARKGTAKGKASASPPPRKGKGKAISKPEKKDKVRQMYLAGWTIVPPNVRDSTGEEFAPAMSFDMAGRRKRASGASLIVVHKSHSIVLSCAHIAFNCAELLSTICQLCWVILTLSSFC